MAAKRFVEAHHYSGSYPAARLRYGLYSASTLVGVAVLSVPAQRKVLSLPFPELEPYTESLELGRLVLLDEVPANAESWFLTRAFELAAVAGVRGVVSFSDPMPRRSLDGSIILPGHIGIIYQAKNAIYAGRSTPRTLHILPDGTALNARTLQKIRAGERGRRYGEAQLVGNGARPRREDETPAAWLHEVLPMIGLRSLQHPGCHRYLFRLGTRAQRRAVSIALPALPYPKHLEMAA